MNTVIKVEELDKVYRLGQIGTGTLRDDLKVWWARHRGKPNPLLKIDHTDHSNQVGEDLWALKNVSFQVNQGDVLGIIGRNGAGKSTLLKILSRVTAPTRGRIRARGRIASLLEVGTGFHPDLTGRENIFLNGAILGMTRQDVRRKFDEIVGFSEIEQFIDTPVKRYSSGMYVRLAFAVAAHLESEILIVDEVLAVGDAEFQKKCLGKMGDVAGQGRTVLFVSHNMATVSKLCKSGIWLGHGQILESGTIQDVITQYYGTTAKQKKEYSTGPLKYVSAFQKGEFVEICAEYNNIDISRSSLMLGFVISDYTGRKICGTNQKNDNVKFNQNHSRSEKVIVRVLQPKLFNGTYKLSIWLGNGYKDFFIDEECLEFEILNMASPHQSANSINESGAVYPICDWNFY